MPAILFVVFVVTPLVEIFVLIQVGQVVGTLPTVVALLGISVAGAALVKREGLKAWTRFRAALEETRLPAKEVVDGALLLFGGALLLTPGFVTDAIGLLLLLPPSRALVNGALRSRFRMSIGLGPVGRGPRRGGPQGPAEDVGAGDLDVDVVEVRRTAEEEGPDELDR